MTRSGLLVLLWAANPDRPHLCATPFFNAAAAAALDIEVEMYFTAKAVQLLREGVAAGLHSGPRERETVYGFMQQAARQGVKFFACSQAMDEYGLSSADLIPEACGSAGAVTYMARCLDDAWVTLVY